jgi:hypothetical protein
MPSVVEQCRPQPIYRCTTVEKTRRDFGCMEGPAKDGLRALKEK